MHTDNIELFLLGSGEPLKDLIYWIIWKKPGEWITGVHNEPSEPTRYLGNLEARGGEHQN
jgi:hypothetical protein